MQGLLLESQRPLLLSGDSEDEDHVVFQRRPVVERTDSKQEYTVEDVVEHIGLGKFQLFLLLICGLFSATDALEMLLLSVLSPVLRCEWQLHEWQVPFITTVVFIGMYLGSSLWGSWADKYGRRTIMVIAVVWICYFGILCAFSPDYYWILIMRGLVGMGFGGAVQSFTLASEYLPRKGRAKLLILYGCMWAVGSSFEILLAYLVIPTLGWRYLVAFSALPSVITIAAIYALPESARYLVAAGRDDEAMAVLEKAAKMNKKSLLPGKLVPSQTVSRGNLKDLFYEKMWKTTIPVWVLWFATAFTYYGVILASSEILEAHNVCGAVPTDPAEQPVYQNCQCNLHSKSDYVIMIISTFGEFVAIPINFLTIDSLGRKWTLAINFGFSGLFFVLIQVCTSKTWLTVFIFGVRAFATGTFNCIYIYTTEVYPTNVRSLGLGSGSANARLGAMVTPFIAQVLLRASVPAAVWVYGIVCGLAALLACLLPIETKGREMMMHTQIR